MTNGSDDIAGWISGLADSDSGVRKESARRLYLAGALLFRSAFDEWIADPDFCELVRPFCVEPQGKPSPVYTVGIAVQPDTFEKIRAANCSPRLADVPPDQDAREFELGFAGTCHFDVLTTREPASAGAIARYLAKFGEGIQQIELNVTDVDRATQILRARFGLTPVYPATRAGADGTRVNFFLVPTPNGGKVLIELVEPAASK